MYACYVVYNEAELFKRSLESIVDFVEKVVVVDGAWSTFPYGEHPESTDGTKEIAEKICGSKLIWVDCKRENGKFVPWTIQIEKRNEYLKVVPNGKWFMVVDADETIMGEIQREFEKIEKNNYRICLVPIVWHKFEKGSKILWTTSLLHQFAIYKKEEGIVYAKDHSVIYLGNKYYLEQGKKNDRVKGVSIEFLSGGLIEMKTPSIYKKHDYIVEGMIISHLDYLRLPARENQVKADRANPHREGKI